MLTKSFMFRLMLAGSAVSAFAMPLRAADTWTYPVYDIKPPRPDASVHTNLPPLSTFTSLKPSEAGGKHHMCLLMPQSQDAVFIAYIYGAVDEAKRLGQAITVFDAGGYDHDADQRGQFENCLTLGVQAILVEAINPTGWDADLAAAKGAGVKVINATEALASPVDGRSLVDFRVNGGLLGEYIAKQHPAAGEKVHALVLPGEAGLPFVEDTVTGFKDKVAGSSVVVDDVIYAGMTETEQLKVVEDALVAHPDVKYIVGNAMAIKQAANVLAQRGMSDKVKLLATYMDKDLLADIKEGKVEAATAESSVMLKRIAVNLAVSAIEGKGPPRDIVPEVQLVTKSNADDPGVTNANFAPDGWKPVFKVD